MIIKEARHQLAVVAFSVLGLLVIPNLLMWILGMEIFLHRSVINVDYLILAAILVWFPAVIRYLGFTLLCALDFLTSAGPAFHFSYRSMLQSVLETLNLQPALFIPIAIAIGIASLMLAIVINRCIRIESFRWAYSLLFIVMALGLHSLDNILSTNILGVNFSTSTLGNVARVIVADSRRETAELTRLESNQATAADILWKIAEDPNDELPDNILLVIVESLGQYKENAVNESLRSRFHTLQNKFDLDSGMVSFKGSTVPGELRELCQLYFSGVHPPAKELATFTCLPKRLKSLGYRTLGIHGYSGSMFQRRQWYPSVFPDDIWFVNELDKLLPERSRCGVSFRGICDADLLSYLSDHAKKHGGKQFNYLLTLNAHLPAYQPDAADADCKQFKTTAGHSQQCYLYQHMTVVLDAIKNYAEENSQSSMIILVGDHMPPFISTNDRNAFDEGHVPFMILRSKQ